MSEKKMIATREGFGKEIVALGKENPNILVVDIDIGKSCKTGEFRKELPDQYINVGIAEQNGAGVAAVAVRNDGCCGGRGSSLRPDCPRQESRHPPHDLRKRSANDGRRERDRRGSRTKGVSSS